MGIGCRAMAFVGTIVGVFALAGGTAGAAWKPDPATYKVGSTLNEPVKMADGTILRADVYFPEDPKTGGEAKGSFPVIVTQTPYGKGSGAIGQFPAGRQLGELSGTSPYLVRRGYIDVIVDVRGTGSSQGSWGLLDPIQASDGAHVIRWAAELPHSDGRVGTLGASYLGIMQLLSASKLGPHSPLKAMFPIISGNDIYKDTVTQGGLIDFEFGGFYLGLTGSLNLLNPLLEAFTEQPTNPDLIKELADHIGGLLAYHATALANLETGGDESYDGPYWKARSPLHTLRTVVRNRIPTFLVGGWYDLFQRGEPLNYSGLQNVQAGRAPLRPMLPGQRPSGRYQLMMGPWYHVTAGEGINMNRLELRWFDRWLKRERTGIERTRTPLHLQELGTNRWVDAGHYPLEKARARTYYLRSGGTLARRPAPPKTGGSDQLLYTGANSPCGRSSDQWGAGLLTLALQIANGKNPCDDDDSSNSGPGVSTYTTPPFKRPRVIAGPMDASLRLASNRPETELSVTIDDVAPDGKSTPLTSGALLGSLRKLDRKRSWLVSHGHLSRHGKPLLPFHTYTKASQKPVPTGKTERYDIEVFPTFARLARGHRLRLRVATSDVPHLLPTPAQQANLTGGIYQLRATHTQRSFLEVATAPAKDFQKPCALCR